MSHRCIPSITRIVPAHQDREVAGNGGRKLHSGHISTRPGVPFNPQCVPGLDVAFATGRADDRRQANSRTRTAECDVVPAPVGH